MKKSQILIITFVVITTGFCLILFLNGYGIKYPTTDCVTYFDKDGQYQLLYVGNNYYLYDAKTEKSICPTIRYYLHDNDIVYLIHDIFVGGNAQSPIYEKRYAIFDIATGKLTSKKTKDELGIIFTSEKNMIELPREKSDFERWISDFIPLKFRKK